MGRTRLILLALLLASCGSSQKSEADMLQATLMAYGKAMRWGDVDQMISYIDPEMLTANPIPALELERFQQVQIAGYRDQGPVMLDETHASQVAQIELINRHTQQVRSIVDRQQWRLDREAKRWWLVSGLPKIADDR